MKQKITLFFIAVVFAASAFAQDDKKPSLVGIHFNALDIYTPVTLNNSDLPREFTKLKDMDFGFGISYWKGLTRTIDFSGKMGVLFHDYAS